MKIADPPLLRSQGMAGETLKGAVLCKPKVRPGGQMKPVFKFLLVRSLWYKMYNVWLFSTVDHM